MKLHVKIILTISTLIIAIIGLLYFVFSLSQNRSVEEQMGMSTLNFAHAIASMDIVEEGLYNKVDYRTIQEFISEIQEKTTYQYIIVMDMEGIQYSYPYDVGLGREYKNGGEDKVLLEGVSYVNADRNELISAIRGFAPVFYEGKQVGAVLVALLTDEVQSQMHENRLVLEVALFVGLFFGVFFASYLAYNIKKAIFGLEPKEIGILLSERELIFDTIEKAIVSVDCEGKLLLYNKAAEALLNIPEDSIGTNINEYNAYLGEVFRNTIEDGKNQYNQHLISDNKHIIINSCMMLDPDKQKIGLVASIEELTIAIEYAYELTGYQEIIDSLRAQNHEFLNKLHTIGGLIQLGNMEEALNYIDALSVRGKELQHILIKHIHSKKIAGLLLAKSQRFYENKVIFDLLHESRVYQIPNGMTEESVCSIIGNLLENSFEALKSFQEDQAPLCEIFIYSDQEKLEIIVHNNGPEILVDEDQLFKRGYSTKESGQNQVGQGLYLIKEIVNQFGGSITFENEEGVTWYVNVPK